MFNSFFNTAIFTLDRKYSCSFSVSFSKYSFNSCQFNNKLLPLRKKVMYGISKIDLLWCQDKIERQKKYLEAQSYLNSFGEVKTLLDLSMSANFSNKYYAEITNRVNTFASFAIDLNQKPVFLTITLNGCFRCALNGDYSKFKDNDMKFLPDEIKYKIKRAIPLTIKDLVGILNYQWNLFIMRYNRKYKGLERSYIRCFEPHKKDVSLIFTHFFMFLLSQ